ncbi:CheR family methyltransferase [Arenibaculum pallidiluteum]|uniref:CheR family methyltransferase n=1 Tax=Arenibaculum pallidiluteum TaxID=2812559 RepID=UPI001A96379F|nr:protein-glutamate O-methyltransferase CheR [Arenibaculum pallidiluteum]
MPPRNQSPSAVEIPIHDEEFRRLCEFFYRRTGMTFSDAKRYFVDRRLRNRIAATGSGTFAAYFARLLVDAAEVEQLINAFTINETYFFREDHQLRCLTSAILERVVAGRRPGATIRLWSVPCSTGEEPYSIGIWLLENWSQVDSWDIEIVGSDIDTEALRAAEAGIYSERSLMRLPPYLVSKYFTRLDESQYLLAEDLRGSVRFSQVNVMDRNAMARHGSFDVIFCRNMLIYFDDKSRREAADNLYDSLAPGGFICLGHTESMSRISSLFQVCRFADAIVYQKPEGPSDA